VIAVQWQNLTHRHWCIIINSSDKTLSAACHSAGLVEIEINHWHYTDFRYVQHSAETGTTVHRTWPHLSYTYISSDDLNWWQIILASVVQFKLQYLFTIIVDFFLQYSLQRQKGHPASNKEPLTIIFNGCLYTTAGRNSQVQTETQLPLKNGQ